MTRPGEAYDKVARMLALGYPGGPVIDKLAAHGNPRAIRFADPKIKGNPFDFSFSGIKTAVLYHLRRNPQLQPGNRSAATVARARRAQRGFLARSFVPGDARPDRELSALSG